jgi:hypothetical protein
MAALGPPDKPEIRRWYPHMLAEDAIVWTAWLLQNAHRLTGVWYDVHVGTAVQPPADLGPIALQVAAAVSRKRIDVVAKTPAELWVIELKPYGNYTALGQALVYSRLFALENPGSLPIVPMVICFEVDPDLPDDFTRYGVRFEEVGYPA